MSRHIDAHSKSYSMPIVGHLALKLRQCPPALFRLRSESVRKGAAKTPLGYCMNGPRSLLMA
jgi:hypothetical protein